MKIGSIRFPQKLFIGYMTFTWKPTYLRTEIKGYSKDKVIQHEFQWLDRVFAWRTYRAL